jgi:hypothetical protein
MIAQVENRIASSSELLVVAGRIKFIEECVQILVESVRDRIVGYPTMEGWETGKYVPFEADTVGSDGQQRKQRMYPLKQPPVPLDWQVSKDIDVDGTDDPFLDPRLKEFPTALSSTKTAHYRIPGRFYNEASAPPMNVTMELLKDDGLYQSTGDLTVFLKSIYEAVPEFLTVEINFFNGGEGSTLQFPAKTTDDATYSETYTSAGCEWMNTLKNPYTGKPYASEAKCPPPGTTVPTRLHNPMESRSVQHAMRCTDLQFGKHINPTAGGNSTTSSSAIDNIATAAPPNNSQKSKRDKIIDSLVCWEGPVLSPKDNKSKILTSSKAIYDRM